MLQSLYCKKNQNKYIMELIAKKVATDHLTPKQTQVRVKELKIPAEKVKLFFITSRTVVYICIRYIRNINFLKHQPFPNLATLHLNKCLHR